MELFAMSYSPHHNVIDSFPKVTLLYCKKIKRKNYVDQTVENVTATAAKKNLEKDQKLN